MPYKFEYEKEQKAVKLTDEVHDWLVSSVFDDWDKWDKIRRPNLEAAEAVERVIYPSKKPGTKSDITMPEIYEIRETYKAHLWKSWFSSLDSMFDVQGKSKDDHFRATQQKAALINIFRDIDIVSKFEKGLDNWINRGEFVAFINWKTKVVQKRRKDLSYVDENGQIMPEFVVKDELVYDGPDITVVNPEAFVFDSAKKENFDSCPKIYRSWATYDEIASNKLYENFEELESLAGNNPSSQSSKKGIKGDQIELLEFWGDIKLKDGTLLKNWVITVAGRERVIRFEKNPFIINPFVFASFIEDPVTKRGISPLFVAIPLNEISTTILNLQIEALKLIVNKPYLAPKGSLSGQIKVREGAIIEYDPALMPKEPTPLDFKDALVGWDFLKFFEEKIESATGIFKYMTGNPGMTSAKTATEASGIMLGQNVRLAKEVDVLNFRVKIPVIQKIAELMANFSFDLKEIKISKPNGDIDFVLVDEAVRQGNYDYTIGDGVAIFERKARLKESLDVLYQFSKMPEIAPRIKWVEVLKWTFEQLGSVDPNIFIRNDVVDLGSMNIQ